MHFTRNVASAAVALVGLAACTPSPDLSSGFGTFAEEQSFVKAQVNCLDESYNGPDMWVCTLRAYNRTASPRWSVQIAIHADGNPASPTHGQVRRIDWGVTGEADNPEVGIPKSWDSFELEIQGSDPYNDAREYFNARFLTDRLKAEETNPNSLGVEAQLVQGPFLIESSAAHSGWLVWVLETPAAAGR